MRRLVDADKLMDGLGRLATDTDLCKRYGNCTPWIPYSTVRKLISDMILEAKESYDDAVSRQEAIGKIKKRLYETALNNVGIKQNIDETLVDVAENRLENWFDELPSVQPKLKELSEWKADFKGYINALNMPKDDYDGIMEYIDEVPYTQPDAVTASLEELINDYGEDGYFIVDGVNYQANELLNELKINSSIGEKFRIRITKTIVAYFMKFGD